MIRSEIVRDKLMVCKPAQKLFVNLYNFILNNAGFHFFVSKCGHFLAKRQQRKIFNRPISQFVVYIYVAKFLLFSFPLKIRVGVSIQK